MIKISPTEIEIYSKIDKESIPENLKNFKEEMLDKHHLRAPHHIEYWTKKEIVRPITLEDFVLLIIHFVEVDKPIEEAINQIRNTVEENEDFFNNLYFENVSTPIHQLIENIVDVIKNTEGN